MTKKVKCILCGRELGDDYSSLMYQGLDEQGETQDYEYAKICNSCSNILDRGETVTFDTTEDEDEGEEASTGTEEVYQDWEEVSTYID